MATLIGITGRARSGKDTFASALVEMGFKRSAFADALKVVTAHLAQESEALYFGDETKEEFSASLGMTRRIALQRVGSGLRQALGPDVFANVVVRGWMRHGKPATVVTDVRYDNEAEMIQRHGGIIVHILRPDNVGLCGEAAAHESERGVHPDLVNVTVVNDGTIEELLEEARRVAHVFQES
jgi:hypothetical protein